MARAGDLRPCANLEDALCGSIEVPLDRRDPSSEKVVRVGFELYRRAEVDRPSLGTLVFMEGGPGYSSTSSRFWYLRLAGDLRRRRDVLLVDARGTGRSDALHCPGLQSYDGNYLDNARDCARRLGAAATLHGSGNAADDLIAVLDALKIDRIDLYGDSYGTFNAQTFAVRHPERVRSLVLDGAYPIAGLDPWYPDTARAAARAFTLTCTRSRSSCPVSPQATSREIAAFAKQLEDAPFEGRANDADGKPRHVKANVDTLISAVSAADGQSVVYRELFAARAALAAGDRAPLLRLIAETSYWGDAGRPRVYSEAHAVAVACHDYPWNYDLAAPEAERRRQFAEARRALPAKAFAPFPRDAWAKSSWMAYDLCLTWPAPKHHDPAFPDGATYPDVPVLVLNGDLDQRTSSESARRVAANFPVSSFVEVANLGHVTALNDFDGCTEAIVRTFWRNLAPPDVACARTEYAPSRVLRAFPRRLADVDGAWRMGNASPRLRRAALLAAATAADVTWRWQSMLGTRGAGLRGGRFTVEGDEQVTFRLDGVQLVEDVAASGTVRWNRRTGAVAADLALSGATSGKLRVRWADGRSGTVATATGSINGRRLDGAFVAP
jgi:pimeloyl-ACP methyl ester carboxylesterase